MGGRVVGLVNGSVGGWWIGRLVGLREILLGEIVGCVLPTTHFSTYFRSIQPPFYAFHLSQLTHPPTHLPTLLETPPDFTYYTSTIPYHFSVYPCVSLIISIFFLQNILEIKFKLGKIWTN